MLGKWAVEGLILGSGLSVCSQTVKDEARESTSPQVPLDPGLHGHPHLPRGTEDSGSSNL